MPGSIRVGYTLRNPTDPPARLEAGELGGVEMVRAALGVLAGLKLATAYALGEGIRRAPEALGGRLRRQRRRRHELGQPRRVEVEGAEGNQAR